jgi:hypothetical protein
MQYYLSGFLDGALNADPTIINGFLFLYANLGWWVFDRTKANFLLGLATALSGPVAELILINQFHLYSYTHADFFGICSWIPWVYFLGGPAVGNLARGVYSRLSKQQLLPLL